MKSPFKHTIAAAIGGLFLSAAPLAEASITFTGGAADLTFYYNSVGDTWVTVFRAKGTTGEDTTAVASGLTSPFNDTSTPSTWSGIVGNIVPGEPGETGDYTFNELRVNLTSEVLTSVNGTNYYLSPASGSPFLATGSDPDLGIRTRLRENFGSGNVTQFDSMQLTLDWDNSTRPDGAEFALFGWDPFNNPIALYDTADEDFSHLWGSYEHLHRNFGFTKPGEYSLLFNIDGIGGAYGETASTGQVTLNFTVIPEPSTALLSITALAALGLRRRRA